MYELLGGDFPKSAAVSQFALTPWWRQVLPYSDCRATTTQLQSEGTRTSTPDLPPSYLVLARVPNAEAWEQTPKGSCLPQGETGIPPSSEGCCNFKTTQAQWSFDLNCGFSIGVYQAEWQCIAETSVEMRQHCYKFFLMDAHWGW